MSIVKEGIKINETAKEMLKPHSIILYICKKTTGPSFKSITPQLTRNGHVEMKIP